MDAAVRDVLDVGPPGRRTGGGGAGDPVLKGSHEAVLVFGLRRGMQRGGHMSSECDGNCAAALVAPVTRSAAVKPRV